MLYADSFISKQQLRRAILRTCSSFDENLDGENAIATFAQLLIELVKRSLVLTQTLSILCPKLISEDLTSASEDFRMTFTKELSVLAKKEEYVKVVSAMITEYLDSSQYPSQTQLAHFEKKQDKFRAFFTQDVIANRWGIFNWIFIRQAIEQVLARTHTDMMRDPNPQVLQDLFDKVATPGNGFAAMDFGYAFDSLIWVCNQSYKHYQFSLLGRLGPEETVHRLRLAYRGHHRRSCQTRHYSTQILARRRNSGKSK